MTPHPAIVVSFRSFDTVCGEPVRCTVEVADTVLQEGQGMHGSFSRADTWNFMAMQGPDFKSHFVDPAPASNADVGRTIAQVACSSTPATKASLSAACCLRRCRTAPCPHVAEPGREVRAGAERARDGVEHANGRSDALFRCGRISGTDSRSIATPRYPARRDKSGSLHLHEAAARAPPLGDDPVKDGNVCRIEACWKKRRPVGRMLDR